MFSVNSFLKIQMEKQKASKDEVSEGYRFTSLMHKKIKNEN